MLNNKRVGLNIKHARNERALTQQQLAEETDLSVTHIAHLECGTVSLSVNSLIAICEVLRVTPNDILRGSFSAQEEDTGVGVSAGGYPLRKKERDLIIDIADLLTKYEDDEE